MNAFPPSLILAVRANPEAYMVSVSRASYILPTVCVRACLCVSACVHSTHAHMQALCIHTSADLKIHTSKLLKDENRTLHRRGHEKRNASMRTN